MEGNHNPKRDKGREFRCRKLLKGGSSMAQKHGAWDFHKTKKANKVARVKRKNNREKGKGVKNG